MDAEELKKAKNHLRSVIELAEGNWPRASDVRIETCGTDPQARITISTRMLREITGLSK